MSPLFILSAISFISMVGFGITYPLLPALQIEYHLNSVQVGILGAIFPFAQFFSSPFLGALSDQHGRRKVISVSFFFFALSFLLFGISKSYTMLLVSRAIGGFFSGAFVAAMAGVADISTPENRMRYMGIIGMAFGFGFMSGPSIGGLLAGNDPQHVNLLLVGGVAFIFTGASCLIALKLPETRTHHLTVQEEVESFLQILKKAFSNKISTCYIMLSILTFFIFSGLEVFLSVWAAHKFMLSAFYIGIFWTFFAFVLNTGRLFLIKKMGNDKGMISAFLVISIMILFYIFINDIYSFYIVSGIIALMSGILFTVIPAKISLNAKPSQQGLLAGINNSAGNLGRFIGPYILGVIWHQTNNIHNIWLTVMFSGIIGVVIGVMVYRISVPSKKEY
jgi:MFS family permease